MNGKDKLKCYFDGYRKERDAMLRLMFECRTANAHIAKCLHTSYERFSSYIERGLDAYHVERSLYTEVKNGGFSKRNTFLKGEVRH